MIFCVILMHFYTEVFCYMNPDNMLNTYELKFSNTNMYLIEGDGSRIIYDAG